MARPSSHTQVHKHVVQVMKEVAAALGNQPATARTHDVHPAILDACAEGRLDKDQICSAEDVPPELSPEEHRLLERLGDGTWIIQGTRRCSPVTSPSS